MDLPDCYDFAKERARGLKARARDMLLEYLTTCPKTITTIAREIEADGRRAPTIKPVMVALEAEGVVYRIVRPGRDVHWWALCDTNRLTHTKTV